MSTACPVCAGPTGPTTLPVRVKRRGREVLRLKVPARACGQCGHVDVSDHVTEELVSLLEARTRPGDDIVFPDTLPG